MLAMVSNRVTVQRICLASAQLVRTEERKESILARVVEKLHIRLTSSLNPRQQPHLFRVACKSWYGFMAWT